MPQGFRAFCALSTVFLSSCVSDAPSAPLVSGVTVEIVGAPSDGVLIQGRELQLSAVVRGADSAEVSGVQLAWSSTASDRASVSADGRVIGVSPGETTVRVNAGGATDQRSISVRTGVPLPTGSSPLSTTLLGGAVRVTLAAGAVPAGTVLHLRAIVDPPEAPRLVSSTAFELGPPGVEFSAPVTLALAYPSVIAVAEQPFLRLHRLTNGEWILVPGGSVDLSAGRALAVITRTGTYAILRPASAATLRIDDGNNQLALAGTFVAVAPRVMVRDAQDQPVEGAVVRFSVSAGGGAIVGDATAVSGADGRATLPGRWRLGPSSAVNTLSAEVDGSSASRVTFTATAETVSLVLTQSIAGAVSGRPATTQPRLEFRSSSGSVLPVSDGVTAELLSGNGTLVGTLRVDASNGVASFTNLRIDGTGAHRLRFISGGRQIDGGVFTVTQELAALEILVQPGGAEEDEAFDIQPVIRLLDDAGLLYLPDKAVTAVIASGSGDLRGNRTVTSSAGLATFTNLRIDNDGAHRLRFQTTSPTLTVTSVLFFVIGD